MLPRSSQYIALEMGGHPNYSTMLLQPSHQTIHTRSGSICTIPKFGNQAHGQQLMHFLRHVGRLQSVIIDLCTGVFVSGPHFRPYFPLSRQRPFCSCILRCYLVTEVDVLKPVRHSGLSEGGGFLTFQSPKKWWIHWSFGIEAPSSSGPLSVMDGSVNKWVV